MAQGFIYTDTKIEKIKEIFCQQHYGFEEDIFAKWYYKGKIKMAIIKTPGEITKILFEDLTFWKENGGHNGMNDISKEGKRLLENLVNQLSNVKITDHLGKKFMI